MSFWGTLGKIGAGIAAPFTGGASLYAIPAIGAIEGAKKGGWKGALVGGGMGAAEAILPGAGGVGSAIKAGAKQGAKGVLKAAIPRILPEVLGAARGTETPPMTPPYAGGSMGRSPIQVRPRYGTPPIVGPSPRQGTGPQWGGAMGQMDPTMQKIIQAMLYKELRGQIGQPQTARGTGALRTPRPY